MKKITLILIALIWISSLIILIVALTDLIPNPFKDFRLIIGMGFIALTGLLGLVYRKLLNI